MNQPIVAFAHGCWFVPAARAKVGEHAELVGEDRLAEAVGLYVDSAHPPRIDAAYLDGAPKLKMICSANVGYDNIDVAECTRRGIAVSTSRGALTDAVADVTLVQIIATFRKLAEGLQWVSDGRWPNGPPPLGRDVAGSTLGIVGLGEIGLAVAKRALACGMHVIYNNRRPRDDDRDTQARYRAFDALLQSADCIVLLLPLSAATQRMFGAQQFALMKPTAFLVNVARGAIVDTDALLAALKAKKIAGAALDVTDPEPLPADHPLLRLPNVFITPHIGSATTQTRERMSMFCAQNLVAGVAGSPLPQIINPEVYA